MKRYLALFVSLAALAIAVVASATSGRVPTVGRTAITPITSISGLPGLRWWIQPSGINATTAVDSWTDASGHGFTISETGTNRPTVAISVLDGANGVQFTKASSQRLSTTNVQLVTGAGNGLTLCMVLRPDATDNTLQVYFGNVDPGFGQGFEFGASTGNKYDGLFPSLGGTLANTVSISSFHFVCWVQPGWGNGKFLYDGVSQTLSNILVPGTTNPLTATSTGNFHIGNRTNNTAHANLTLVEAFACEGVLPDTDLATARTIEKTTYPSLP